jgi:ketosteroid isomerase-like protein
VGLALPADARRPGPRCPEPYRVGVRNNGAMSETNVEIARRGYAAVARADVDAIREFLDPDVKWHGGDPSFPGACHNSDDVVAVIREARRRGGIGELVDVVDAGDQVVAIMRPPGTGEDDTRLRANVTNFRDGRVVEMVAHESPDEALATVRRR